MKDYLCYATITSKQIDFQTMAKWTEKVGYQSLSNQKFIVWFAK